MNARQRKELMLRFRAPSVKGMKRPHRKPKGPTITKKRLKQAIKGSLGIKKRIAERLRVGWCAVQVALHRPGWESCLAAWQRENDSVGDLMESTVLRAAEEYEDNPEHATLNARWFLEKRHPDKYSKRTEHVLSGGKQPIQVQTQDILPVDSLPLALRKELLKAIENEGSSLVKNSDREGKRRVIRCRVEK